VKRQQPLSVRLERPSPEHQREFLSAVERSRKLHGTWVAPPSTPAAFRRYLTRNDLPHSIGHFVIAGGELAGVVNVSEIVLNNFRSAFLGYYAFAPHTGAGVMARGVALVVTRAFRSYRLHRLEANIQPQNRPSISLVRRLGFRLEGYSPRYLRIAGRYRDHERWAITVEDWRARSRPGGKP
jgi:ribosomal-protein-alanine N-acetyltransferase